MPVEVINLASKLSQFSEKWSPRIVAQLNDYHVKLAIIEGDFIWHNHPETDELFLVLEGSMVIHLRDEDIQLSSGELCIVPKGVDHKPAADSRCTIMLVEPIHTLNMGSVENERDASEGQWI